MYENITKNKLKTAFIMIGFLLFISVIGYVVGMYIDLQYGISRGYSFIFMIFALIVAVVLSFASYFNSDRIVLRMSKAVPMSREKNPRIYYMVEGLSIAAGIPMPKIYVIGNKGMNAFATGRNPENSVIVLTEGIIDNLNDSELKGVIAHELSHIKNYDILLGTIVVVMVGMITIISNIILRSFMFRGGKSRSNKSGGGVLSLILLALGLIFIILSPIVATIIKLAINRSREFLADANGALITRYPAGLSNALRKIAACSEVETANNATAHLFIANPYGKKSKVMFKNLFNTHPPVEERIKRLDEMALGVGVNN